MSGRRKSLESVPPLHDDLLSPVAFSPCMLCLQSEFGGGGDGTALHNQVFYSVVNNRPVVMEELRKSIAKMVTLVTRKNHWFCVWSVLKHHNLIRVLTIRSGTRRCSWRRRKSLACRSGRSPFSTLSPCSAETWRNVSGDVLSL